MAPSSARHSTPRRGPAETGRTGRYNIGQAAAATGVSAKMIRHYEAIGLIPQPQRTFANYRVYTANDLHTLRFVRRARSLGFSIDQIEALLGLWRGRKPSSQVRKMALQHVDELEARLREMAAMRDTLRALASRCHDDNRPECPILEDLAAGELPSRR